MADIPYLQVLVKDPVKVMILWTEMKESGVLEKTALVFGQMNEPPGARMRVAETGLTMAEYFRDVEHQNVLLFIDNIFRFTTGGFRGISPFRTYAISGRLSANPWPMKWVNFRKELPLQRTVQLHQYRQYMCRLMT